jgi:hypothetical protein
VLEFDPTTLKIVWQYTPIEAGLVIPSNSHMFYSGLVSSAQRLPNGNTLITEGVGGRILEVTPAHELVWEYVSPYKSGPRNTVMVYRAYRVPYEWVPQVARPEEKSIHRIDNGKFRVPGSPRAKARKITALKSRLKLLASDEQFCVLPKDERGATAR